MDQGKGRMRQHLEPQLEPFHYYRIGYDTKNRWNSYWHQINEILLLKPETVLEVGIGNGLVANYLKQSGLDITTLDIDEKLNPDYTGSVLGIPFPDESFEVVACFEVLEHLPYEDVPKALREIRRVSKLYVVLSLPDTGKAYRVYIQIPKIGEFRKLIPLPRLRAPIHKFDGEHYWEIGKAGYPLEKITDHIRNAGFELRKTYRAFEMPYHRFFVLEKVNKEL
jgi:ubiquinone/menaquinone biosynthesis C-methylase UbiE